MESIILINKIIGIALMVLVLLQIIFGRNSDKLTKKFGKYAFKLHIISGISIIVLLSLHAFFWIYTNYLGSGKIDIYRPFIDLCLLCRAKTDLYFSMGGFSFWILLFTVSAYVLRKTKIFKNNWRDYHILGSIVIIPLFLHVNYYLNTQNLAIVKLIFYVFILITAIFLILKLDLKDLKKKIEKILDQ